MSLITRQFGPNPKGSRLTFQEMDDNLLYLESLGDGIAYYGQMSEQTGVTVSIATASTYQSLGFSGTLDSQVFGLTAATDFGLKNISGNTILVEVFGSVDLDNGNNQEYGIKLAKNGVVIDETECRAESGSSHSLVKLVTNWMIELDDQDEVEIYLTNFTSTGNLTIERAKIVASSVGKTDIVVNNGSTQSYIMNIPDLSSLIDYSLNGNGTYSDFTYAKVLQFPTIINSVDFLSATLSTVSTLTASIYNGTALFDITGGNNIVDVTSVSFRIMEGSDASNDIDYYYRIDFTTTEIAQSYEFYQMATHSTYQYAHYFKLTDIDGDAGGAIELSFDGVTVDLQFGSNTLFTRNLP